VTKNLVRRAGIWRFVRRVPKQFEALDKRGIVQESTKVRVADDPKAIRAGEVADQINLELETFWRALADGNTAQATREYEEARAAARKLKISPPISDGSKRTIEELLARIEALERAKADDGRSAYLAVGDAVVVPGITFRQCGDQYIETHKPSWSNPKHADQWDSTMESYVYPVIGDVPVARIVNGDGTELVLKILRPIWHTKTETASRIRGRIEIVLDWAKARGFRNGENPARWKGHLALMLPAKSKIAPTKHHPAMPYAKLPMFIQALRARPAKEIASRALEFTVLTAGRSTEILLAQWTEINEAARMWTVPAERMKGKRIHRVALSDAAMAILKGMPRDGAYVFPGRKPGKPLSNMAMLQTLERMGVRNEAVTHGFRSTFRDWAAEETNYPNELLEMAIAHKVSDEVEAAYRRGDMLKKRHQLMADWEAYCLSGKKAEA
jgi:integrase